MRLQFLLKCQLHRRFQVTLSELLIFGDFCFSRWSCSLQVMKYQGETLSLLFQRHLLRWNIPVRNYSLADSVDEGSTASAAQGVVSNGQVGEFSIFVVATGVETVNINSSNIIDGYCWC